MPLAVGNRYGERQSNRRLTGECGNLISHLFLRSHAAIIDRDLGLGYVVASQIPDRGAQHSVCRQCSYRCRYDGNILGLYGEIRIDRGRPDRPHSQCSLVRAVEPGAVVRLLPQEVADPAAGYGFVSTGGLQRHHRHSRIVDRAWTVAKAPVRILLCCEKRHSPGQVRIDGRVFSVAVESGQYRRGGLDGAEGVIAAPAAVSVLGPLQVGNGRPGDGAVAVTGNSQGFQRQCSIGWGAYEVTVASPSTISIAAVKKLLHQSKTVVTGLNRGLYTPRQEVGVGGGIAAKPGKSGLG